MISLNCFSHGAINDRTKHKNWQGCLWRTARMPGSQLWDSGAVTDSGRVRVCWNQFVQQGVWVKGWYLRPCWAVDAVMNAAVLCFTAPRIPVSGLFTVTTPHSSVFSGSLPDSMWCCLCQEQYPGEVFVNPSLTHFTLLPEVVTYHCRSLMAVSSRYLKCRKPNCCSCRRESQACQRGLNVLLDFKPLATVSFPVT